MNVYGRNRRVPSSGDVAKLHAVVRVGRHQHVLGHRVKLHIPREGEDKKEKEKAREGRRKDYGEGSGLSSVSTRGQPAWGGSRDMAVRTVSNIRHG